MVGRLALIAILLVAGAVVTVVYRARRAADEGLGATDTDTGAHLWPALPAELLTGAAGAHASPPATWVIFSTPLCVTCSAVQAHVERNFPHHRVLKIDATERPELAAPYDVRRAPTTLLADARGTIVERLVGAESVSAFIGTGEDASLN